MDNLQEIIDYGILGLLGVMSFLSLAFFIERLLFYGTIRIEQYRHKNALEIDLTRRLTAIATIASNAPYVGLLGTVLGIMLTFMTMGSEGLTDTKALMTGLALALKATAFGLVVAIPSIMFYNHLVRKQEVLLAEWEILQDSE